MLKPDLRGWYSEYSARHTKYLAIVIHDALPVDLRGAYAGVQLVDGIAIRSGLGQRCGMPTQTHRQVQLNTTITTWRQRWAAIT